MLDLLFTFLQCPSAQSYPAAMAVLLEGGAVELTVGHMTEAGLDIPGFGIEMFHHFLKDPPGRNRVSAPGVVSPLMKWTAEWLPKVRLLTPWYGLACIDR
jgi:hypothetical protein